MVLNKSIFEENEQLLPKSDKDLKKNKPSKPKPTKKTKDEVLNEFDLISQKIIELSKKEEAKKTRKPRVLSPENTKKMDRTLALARAKSLETRKAKSELRKMEKAKQLLETKNNQDEKAKQTNKVEFKSSSDENPLKIKLNEAIKLIEMQKHYINSLKSTSETKTQPPKPFSID